MANRIIDNIYIIDSQMGGQPLIVGSAAWLRNAIIQAVAFWSADTTGVMELAYLADTTNVAFRITPDGPAGTSGYSSTRYVGKIRFSELTTKTLTAGTGWIYFA